MYKTLDMYFETFLISISKHQATNNNLIPIKYILNVLLMLKPVLLKFGPPNNALIYELLTLIAVPMVFVCTNKYVKT